MYEIWALETASTVNILLGPILVSKKTIVQVMALLWMGTLALMSSPVLLVKSKKATMLEN